jgi:hypothetical protein
VPILSTGLWAFVFRSSFFGLFDLVGGQKGAGL